MGHSAAQRPRSRRRRRGRRRPYTPLRPPVETSRSSARLVLSLIFSQILRQRGQERPLRALGSYHSLHRPAPPNHPTPTKASLGPEATTPSRPSLPASRSLDVRSDCYATSIVRRRIVGSLPLGHRPGSGWACVALLSPPPLARPRCPARPAARCPDLQHSAAERRVPPSRTPARRRRHIDSKSQRERERRRRKKETSHRTTGRVEKEEAGVGGETASGRKSSHERGRGTAAPVSLRSAVPWILEGSELIVATADCRVLRSPTWTGRPFLFGTSRT